MADLAIMMTGHVGVPIYPTLMAEAKYTLEHSESKLLFVGKLDAKPWDAMKNGIPEDMKCISFPLCPDGLEYDKWADCVKKDEIKEVKKRTEDEMATIIYTSGSTGVPKGVMLSFKNTTVPTFGLIGYTHVTENDHYLSYLPVSHGMERWVGECVPFVSGMRVFFADSLSPFVQDLGRAKPTLFLSVPRLWTKFQQGVFKKMPPHKLEKLLKIPIISWLVKKKLLKALGLDCVRYAGSGSTPLPPDLLAWYRNLGWELLKGYGMTENFNFSHGTKPGRGRVGYALAVVVLSVVVLAVVALAIVVLAVVVLAVVVLAVVLAVAVLAGVCHRRGRLLSSRAFAVAVCARSPSPALRLPGRTGHSIQ
ncbi:hypothetical protein ACHAWF_009470 [Thalassiosira exigua]